MTEKIVFIELFFSFSLLEAMPPVKPTMQCVVKNLDLTSGAVLAQKSHTSIFSNTSMNTMQKKFFLSLAREDLL